mmetsp:Transcript_40846/g.85005  ORF Transcript_40846/g.85005 Transcript_40846/m.85005 type:complete len:1211 (-) Transcript_40846:1229-4861(-)|eukprot:CAMPEP_0172440724 /NCGR_PEP_ID=MMETSP1065-20121228/1339_1 /TAXON_ID=265537 /ORGANISM="Amphiprora paludosa, Strain CCMP125" /LENGTH=1210 /DNA_ID=CAMNT_0013189709 /DNA_START=73 /DNA_END=3705 /DNA_ORIENTATION=-
MSESNPGASKGRLGFRFRRSKEPGDGQKESLSFDDMESLGMESGSKKQNNSRGRFRIIRGKQSDSGSNHGRPDVITTHGRPEVITTRSRARSADELSFDGSSFPDSASNSGAGASAAAATRSSTKPPKYRVLKRFIQSRKIKSADDKASDEPSDRSASQHPSVQHAESFDSDDMLKYVKPVDSTVRYEKKVGPGSGGRARRGRRGDFDGGFEGPSQSASLDGDAPIKRISFDSDAAPGVSDQFSESMVTQGGAIAGAPLIRDMDASVDQSVFSHAATSSQTYRSLGTSDIGTERARYSVREGSRATKKKYRVKPFHAFKDPVHMTEEDIYNDSTKPSVHCEMLKSYLAPSTRAHKKIPINPNIQEKYGSPARDGRIGSLKCEVLGCVSLARKSKPDICVYMVCGDAAFCTDVIQGYRSPMWPSASRRAAVFPIHHGYSRLFVGVFDVRSRKNKENDVFCGRVCIDVASLRPNTEYDITFPLRTSTFVYDRHKCGVVRLRFSLHWFSERAAVLSYFKNPVTMVESCPLEGGCPIIPCADPKTFRNVAVTVHGSDLPGKYSKSAFKATVREFQLYQLNIRYITYFLLLDTVMYEKPYISLYLFFAAMHCILTESVTKVPPYVMGFIIIMFLENYKHYVADTVYNGGYQQLTLLEVFKALVSKTGSQEKFFEPILVTKRAKQRANRRATKTLRRIQADAAGNNTDEADEPLDHREFPLSDREVYPKFSVEDALAPSSKKAGGGHTRLHGRLSVYYAPVDNEANATGDSGDEEDDESSDESNGDETVMDGAGLYDQAFDLDDLDDEDEGVDQRIGAVNSQYGYGGSDEAENGNGRGKLRRLLHSAQDIDDAGGAAVPPQVTVKRVENMFHRRSYSVAVEKVVVPPSKEQVQSADDSYHNQSELNLTTEQIEKQIEEKRKAYLDEFDKLLGLQSRSANPISRIMSTFLGPLMRVMRIPVFMFRIGFNAYTWRDPYLSFWVFCSLCLTLIVLMAFPWRFFFLVATVGGLGPQNILLRRYLEKRARKRKEEAELAKLQENDGYDGSVAGSTHSFGYGDMASSTNPNTSTLKRQSSANENDTASVKSNEPTRRGFFGRKKRGNKTPQSSEPTEFFAHERPPFCSDYSSNANRKSMQPRSVVIPYSKLRKERFYDWPPDPTVSRATPLEFDAWEPEVVPHEIVMSAPTDLPYQRRTSVDTALPSTENKHPDIRRRRGSH